MHQLFNGDCLQQLVNIPDGSIDMVLTDPPYSSGGLFAGARKQDTRTKYCSTDFNGAARFQSFTGDNMDQRSFTAFCREVFATLRPKIKAGGGAGGFHRLEKLASHDGRASDGRLPVARHRRVG